MKLLGLLTAVVVAAATLTTAASAPRVGAAVRKAAPQHQQQRGSSVTAQQLRDARSAVAYFRQKTWSVQRRIPVRPTATNYAERHTRSPAFLHWLKHRWNVRWHAAKRYLAAHRLPFTNDWTTAVRIVQRDWPGTATWMLQCSSGEGGHGIWIWNGRHPYSSPDHGSGAGGWMQYLDTTFASQYASALSRARLNHLPVPRLGANLSRAGVWRESPIAQAFAAGWARLYTDSYSTWDPGIDSNCY